MAKSERHEFLGGMYTAKIELTIDTYKYFIKRHPDKLPQIYAILETIELLDEGIIGELIQSGWNINEANKCYRTSSLYSTPLESACEYRNVYLVKSLLKNGANPNTKGIYLPVTSVIIGNNVHCTKDKMKVSEILLLLREYGATLKSLDDCIPERIKDIYFHKSIVKPIPLNIVSVDDSGVKIGMMGPKPIVRMDGTCIYYVGNKRQRNN
jgi:hypothetical protein